MTAIDSTVATPLPPSPAYPHLSEPLPTAEGPPISPSETAAAVVRVRPALDQLPEGPVPRVNVHIPTAVLIVLGVLPHLEPMRDDIEALPAFDAEPVWQLRDLGLALLYLYARTLPSASNETRLQTLLAEATPLRERLLAGAEGLAYFGLVDAKRVAAIRAGKGHLDTANDLIALAQLFKARWAEVAGKTPITWAEIERAEALGPELVDALGKRRAGTEDADGADRDAHDCARLFGLFARTYDQARRAVSFLRWNEGDVDALLPSLYQGRRRTRGAGPDEPAPQEPGPTPLPGPTPHEPGPTPGPGPILHEPEPGPLPGPISSEPG
jgi:hypothetical protein